MIQRLLPALCALALVSAAAAAQTVPVADAQSSLAPAPSNVSLPPDAVPEQVLVVGKKPGPGLWKVSRGEHVLWIFGTYSPLPAKMAWRSQEVDTIIARSQAFLPGPSMSAQVGFFKQLTLLPFAIGVKKNPDGATLHDLLPADVYARWQVLKKKYIGDDEGIERERPIFAAAELHRRGTAAAGLVNDREVRAAIDQLIKKNKLAIVSSDVKLDVKEPVRMLRDFKKSSMDDVACFTRTLDRLETDIGDLRRRANAWAKGDLDGIEQLDFTVLEDTCMNAVINGSFAKNQPEFQTVQARMRENWLASAESALANNASTFAVLPLNHVLGEKSLVAELKARGYTVEAPR